MILREIGLEGGKDTGGYYVSQIDVLFTALVSSSRTLATGLMAMVIGHDDDFHIL